MLIAEKCLKVEYHVAVVPVTGGFVNFFATECLPVPNQWGNGESMWTLDGLPIDFREDQGRALIDRAWQALKEDLRQDGKADQAMRNSEMVAELVITRAMLLRNEDAFLAGSIDAPRLAAARELYTRRYDAAIRWSAPFMPR